MPAERSKLLQNRCHGPLQIKGPVYENTNEKSESRYFLDCNTNAAEAAVIEDTVGKEFQMKTPTTTRPSSTTYFPATSQERDIFRTREGKVS